MEFWSIFSHPVVKILLVNSARKMKVVHIMAMDDGATKILLQQSVRSMTSIEDTAHLTVT